MTSLRTETADATTNWISWSHLDIIARLCMVYTIYKQYNILCPCCRHYQITMTSGQVIIITSHHQTFLLKISSTMAQIRKIAREMKNERNVFIKFEEGRHERARYGCVEYCFSLKSTSTYLFLYVFKSFNLFIYLARRRGCVSCWLASTTPPTRSGPAWLRTTRLFSIYLSINL